jgi:hypothetical protein
MRCWVSDQTRRMGRMSEPSASASPTGWVGLIGIFLSAAATLAAAASAYFSWQAVQQTQRTQLLDRGVVACGEITAAATNQIVGAMKASAPTDPRVQYEAWGSFETSFSDWDGPQCPKQGRERTDCLRKVGLYEQDKKVVTRAISSLEFEASKKFSLVGSSEVSVAEGKLRTVLAAVAQADAETLRKNNRALIQEAIRARQAFDTACAAAVRPYRFGGAELH